MGKLNLLLVLSGALSLASAENMWSVHGHNYTYDMQLSSGQQTSEPIFPVVWDVRSASILLHVWDDLYSPGQLNPIYGIFQEAAQHGFNSLVIRSELGDLWYPEEPGTYGDDFFPLAGYARELGLHVFIGGISTYLGNDETNQQVLDYLKIYIPMTQGDYPGDVIGFFAFDEPDVKYLENPGQEDQWIQNIDYWSSQIRSQLNLPVMSYFAKYAVTDSSGYMDYYTDTTCVLNRIARFNDVVAIDMYPVKNNFRRTDLLESEPAEPVYVCASDFIQNDNIYISTLNCRDEILSVYSEGDTARVVIQEVLWDGLDMYLSTAAELPLSFLPDRFASSDFRAGYAIQEGDGYVNSGAVFWRDDLPVNRGVLVSPSYGQPVLFRIPGFQGCEDYSVKFISIGQSDFWADIFKVEGIIGRGRLAVLVCLQDSGGADYLMLYVYDGRQIKPVFSQPRKLYFQATGAVWGTFWGRWYQFGTIQPVARNGFIIHDDQGRYISLNQLGRDYWQIFPAYGVSQFTDLFGSSEMPSHMAVSRLDGDYPPFFAGRDELVGFFDDPPRIITASSLYNGGSLTELDTIQVTSLPAGEVTGFELFRNDKRYSDRPLITTGGFVYSGRGSMETGAESGAIEMEQVSYCYGDTILGGIRPMHTRDAIRSALVRCDEGYYVPHCEIYDDVVDHWRFQWYPNAHRTGMQMGIETTARNNTLFAVIQSYGRHGFALPSYYASPDTMLYMVTSPVVQGARGLVFYALDIAMMSGNGGGSPESRAPDVLQNWGPSRDEVNGDMIGTIHQTVSSVTGHGSGSTNYLAALVDPSWFVMNESSACNIDPADSLLNFIALMNHAEDSILIIAVNDATSPSPFQPGIILKDISPGFSVVSSTGYEPPEPEMVVEPDGGTSAVLHYSTIPPVTASLVTLTRTAGGECQGTYLTTATNQTGDTRITFSLCNMEEGELLLYDLYGRVVSVIWQGFGDGNPVNLTLTRGEHPSGMYFAVLHHASSIETGKCIVW